MDSRLLKRKLLIAPFLFWFLFFIVGPICLVVFVSFAKRTPLGEIEATFTTEAYHTLFDVLYLRVLLITVAFAAANTVVTLLLAYPLSYFLSRLKPSTRMWVLTLVLVPFWTSFLIRILAFMDLLRLKPFGLDWIYTAKGVLGALVYNYLPFAVLPIFSAMEKVDPSHIEAARDLGASKRQVLVKVLWPLTRGGVFAAALFVFIPSLGEFLIPDLVGGGQYFLLGSFLHNQFMTARNWPLGAATIVLLLTVTLVFTLFLSLGDKSEHEKALVG